MKKYDIFINKHLIYQKIQQVISKLKVISIIKKMKYLKLFKKYINFNKNFFDNKKKSKKTETILVESFDLKATIISLSIFSNSFKNQENLKIIAFSTYQSLRKTIKIYLNLYFNIFSYLNFLNLLGLKIFNTRVLY